MKKIILLLAILLLSACNNDIAWQDSYAGFLQNPDNFTLQGGAYAMGYGRGRPSGWVSFSFALRDLTQDGVPELLIFYDGSDTASGSGFDIYTFDGNNVVFIDSACTSRARGDYWVSDYGDFLGIFFSYGAFTGTYTRYVELIDGQTIETDVHIYHFDGETETITVRTKADEHLYNAWRNASFFPVHHITEANIQEVIWGISTKCE